MAADARLLDGAIRIARAAGAAIMALYQGEIAVRLKDDHSPVTAADAAAEAIILPALEVLAPDIPIISEEAASAGPVPAIGRRFWLVDPLDGTKEYIKRNGEFTVNIALIEAGRPVLGVVFAPALDRLYAGIVDGGAFIEEAAGRRPIACRALPAEGLTIISSRSHGDAAALDAFLAGRRVKAETTAGSSLKFCLVAAGEADLYPRFGRTMEWDTAAGHAVLAAAGGAVTTLDGTDIAYGKPGLDNPHFVARGRP